MAIYIIGCFVFVASGWYVICNPRNNLDIFMGWLGVLFFGLGGLMLLYLAVKEFLFRNPYLTITDKNGVSTSVNIGFDITKTYASVAAMNADAANVEEGIFVMIATTDTTSAENARLYVRNSNAASSSEPFTFLCDLDQAATSAWADWFNNYKPTIESDHTRAENDHTQASTDHGTASSDHATADSDHTQATTDHGTASADHTLAASDHTTAGTDHTTAGSDHTQALSDHGTATSDHESYGQAIGTINGKMNEISQSDFDEIFNDW